MTLHITIAPNALPLPSAQTLSCLHSFIKQLGLFPKDRHLDRLRYVVFNDLQAVMAPSHGPPNDFTLGAAAKSIAALWYFISRGDLLFEMKFAVFDSGVMVAWGLLGYRERPPKPPPLPTALE